MDREAVETALVELVAGLHPLSGSVLVSGACPTGADRIAEDFAEKVGLPIERHPAEWNKHENCWCRDHSKRCGFAGPRRNKEMVDLGADICVGFVKNNSRGATGTLKLAEEAGIPTRRYDA